MRRPILTALTAAIAIGAATLAMAMSSRAHAQDDVQADASAATLERVTVIAKPLNEVLDVNVGGFGAKAPLDIPLAIQRYDASMIADLSARTLRDVLEIDPSVTSSSYGGGFDNFRLRGFAMDNFNTIRRDGMALAPHYDMPMELVERVDVLKGPSGFLYGFNSPGGTVNYIPKRPTADSFTNLVLQGSSLQGRHVAIDTSQVLGDGTLGYRINAGHGRIGDFDHAGDLERNVLGLATDIRISDRALLQLNADLGWKSTMSDPLLRADQSRRSDRLDPSSFVLPPEVDRRHALSPSWYRHKTEARNIEARFDYRLNDHWSSVSQANHSRVERHGGYVDLFDIAPDGAIGYADLYQSRGEVFTTWSLQTYLAGSFRQGRLHHDVFVGASHRRFTDSSPYWDFVESTGANTVDEISVGNILAPVQPPRWDFGPRQAIDFNSDIRESSIFASDLVSISPRVQVLLGGRQIRYRARNLSAVALPQQKDVFVPTAALIYRPAVRVMTYLSHARGFEKGDYAPYNANNANQPTDAIASEQYEVGLKADLGHRLNLGLAVFDIKRDASYLDLSNHYVSDGRFHHRGIEANASGALDTRLSLFGNVAYLDTSLRDVADATTRGKRSEGAPRWKAAVGARYLVPGLPGLVVDTTLSHVGSRPVDAQNSGFVPAYTLWDAGISYDTQLGRVPTLFRLQARNLADTYYYPGVYYSGGLEVGRGREIILSARFGL